MIDVNQLYACLEHDSFALHLLETVRANNKKKTMFE